MDVGFAPDDLRVEELEPRLEFTEIVCTILDDGTCNSCWEVTPDGGIGQYCNNGNY